MTEQEASVDKPANIGDRTVRARPAPVRYVGQFAGTLMDGNSMSAVQPRCEIPDAFTAFDRFVRRLGLFLVEAASKRALRRSERLAGRIPIPSILDPRTPLLVRRSAPPPGIGR